MKKINSKKPWKTDKLFTSSWNFEYEVIKYIHFSDDLQFYDVSPRWRTAIKIIPCWSLIILLLLPILRLYQKNQF